MTSFQELYDQGAIQLAERVRDLPQPYVSSSKRLCSSCGEPVWVSVGALEFADRLRIVCRPCLEQLLETEAAAREAAYFKEVRDGR